ncbi:hypothetical protein BGM19_26720 [Streptomyces agglomeratus]|uniref:HU family DNA-binding protein n=1 Tax=Streptomyces agglomeratus TaxID=285458 RepID=UPI00086D80B0|nr:HU family DNA-binding protein [Streptomyces agglomeratus]OEJ61070.1 hypothetical protein BGM19_26720 [Streptomyces agglomeratus]
MKKRELVESLAAETGISKRQADHFLGTLVAIVERTLAKGEKVNVAGLGVFDIAKRAARRGVNPATGEFIALPLTIRPYLQAGSRLKRSSRQAE